MQKPSIQNDANRTELKFTILTVLIILNLLLCYEIFSHTQIKTATILKQLEDQEIVNAAAHEELNLRYGFLNSQMIDVDVVTYPIELNKTGYEVCARRGMTCVAGTTVRSYDTDLNKDIGWHISTCADKGYKMGVYVNLSGKFIPNSKKHNYSDSMQLSSDSFDKEGIYTGEYFKVFCIVSTDN